MADEAMLADHGFRTIIRGGNIDQLRPNDFDVLTLSVGGNSALVGDVVTIQGETYPNCDLAITTDNHAYGIITSPLFPDNMTNWTIDVVITDGELVNVIRLNRKLGVQVAVNLEALDDSGAVPVEPGDHIVIGASNAGHVRKWKYTASTSELDSLEEFVGTCDDTDGGSTADDHIIIIVI